MAARTARSIRPAIPPSKRGRRHPLADLFPTGSDDAPELSPKDLRETLGVTREVFARLSGFSVRAQAGWESGDRPPGPQARLRMAELSRLVDGLRSIMKAEAVGAWLNRPNKAFEGLKPVEVIERGRMDRLWMAIYMVGTGTPS